MAKKGGTYTSQVVVVTPKGNYVIPSLEYFKEHGSHRDRGDWVYFDVPTTDYF